MHYITFVVTCETFVHPRSHAFVISHNLLIPRVTTFVNHQSNQAFQRSCVAQHHGAHSVFHSAVSALYESVSWVSISSESRIHQLEKFGDMGFRFFPEFRFFRFLVNIKNFRSIEHGEVFHGVISVCSPSEIEDVFCSPFPCRFVFIICFYG